jgi:hypothetical protein
MELIEVRIRWEEEEMGLSLGEISNNEIKRVPEWDLLD